MRIPQMIMLLFQYTYYVMKKGEKTWWRLPGGSARYRAVGALGLVETGVLGALYSGIVRLIAGNRIPRPPSPPSTSLVTAAFAYGLIVYYFNNRMLGHEGRIHHYKQIFDAWDEGRRLRWKIMLVAIAILSMAAMYVVGEVSQNGLDPHNWKY